MHTCMQAITFLSFRIACMYVLTPILGFGSIHKSQFVVRDPIQRPLKRPYSARLDIKSSTKVVVSSGTALHAQTTYELAYQLSGSPEIGTVKKGGLKSRRPTSSVIDTVFSRRTIENRGWLSQFPEKSMLRKKKP